MIKAFLVLLAPLLLVGCETYRAQMTQGNQETQSYNGGMARADAAAAACWAPIDASPAGKVVFGQIMFHDDGSPNKIDLLTNNAKLDDGQKLALKDYLRAVAPCRSNLLAAQEAINGADANNRRLFYAKSDAIYVALINGQFTIADANKAREQAINEAKSESTAITEQLNQRLQAQNAQENADRAAKAAILLPMLMQQQQNQAQQQQNIYHQQMLQMNNSRTRALAPLPQSVHTTCFPIGNQIHCDSR